LGDYAVLSDRDRNIFFAKYFSDGDLAWVKTLSTTSTASKPEGIAVIDPNNLYVGGYFLYQADFDQIQLTASDYI